MRKFHLPVAQNDDPHIRPTLRTTNPTAAYARRSPAYARDEKKDKSQSREMQTGDIQEWALRQGWKPKDFHPYFQDFGLSGTLPPDQRDDLLRLFDDIDSGLFDDGSVICYQESRLFRDETQIYYNQFIDKCKTHNVVVVAISPYLMIYDFRDDFLTEMFRWKCKEAADFIRRHVKGWMLPARHRAAWNDGEWAGLGNLPIGYIVDYNEQSKTFKRLIPYQPHAEVKKEYRLLFVRLGCNISLLYQRLREEPIVFPEFEAWVDRRNVSHFAMTRHPGGGYAPRSPATVRDMLMDPHDIGYRVLNDVIRRDRAGNKVIDHDSICEQDLWDLCYLALALTDLDGIALREKRRNRYFHRGNKGEFGLLKFRIASTQGDVHTRALGGYDGEKPLEEGTYDIEPFCEDESVGLRPTLVSAAISCEQIDRLVVDRLMEHAQEISQSTEDMAEYQRQAKQHRAKRQKQLAHLKKSVGDAEREQVALTRSAGKLEAEIEEAEKAGDEVKAALKKRRKQLIEEEIEQLEIERMRLLKVISETHEESDDDLGTFSEEIQKLAANWSQYRFEKRRSLINYLIETVIVDVVSTHWVRIQVTWAHKEWESEELYYCRRFGSRQAWTDEDEQLIRQHYPTLPKDQLMALLPERGWEAIRLRARVLGVARVQAQAHKSALLIEDVLIKQSRQESLNDLEFMRQRDIPVGTTITKWQESYPPDHRVVVSPLELKALIRALQLLTAEDKKTTTRKKYA